MPTAKKPTSKPTQKQPDSLEFFSVHRNILKYGSLAVVVLATVFIGLKLLSQSHAYGSTIAVQSYASGVAVPTSGALLGGSIGDDPNQISACSSKTNELAMDCKIGWAGGQQNLTAVAATSYHMPLLHDYINSGTTCPSTSTVGPNSGIVDRANQPGRKLMILSFRCGSWANVASGNKNAEIKALVHAIDANVTTPVVLVFNHEPENDNCVNTSGSGNLGTPDDFRRAFRQFSDSVRAQEKIDGTHKIAVGFILMNQTYRQTVQGDHTPWTGCGASGAGAAIRNAENWYPGDDAVDWIGGDAYAKGAALDYANTISTTVKWAAAACGAGHPTVDWNCSAARATKPVMIGELGYGLCTCTLTQTARTSWLNTMNAQAQDYKTHPEFKSVKAISYYNNGDNDLDAPAAQAASDGHPALKAFAKMAFNPFFNGVYTAPAPAPSPTPTPPSGPDKTIPTVRFGTGVPTGNGQLETGIITISPAATDNVGVVRVSIFVDDVYKQLSTTSPFTMKFDTRTLKAGNHTMQLKAVDAAGNIGYSYITNFSTR